MKAINTTGVNLVKIASDTMDVCDNGTYTTNTGITISIEDALDAAIIDSIFIDPNDQINIVSDETIKLSMELTDETTAIAARRLSTKNVVILNFASAITPGGGFLHGAKAQEEDLCRVSCLYSCLTRDDMPYYHNNKINKTSVLGNNLYTDGIIYSPNVPFIRDEYYNWLEEPFTVSVVTCPAPNVRAGDPNNTDVLKTLEKRIDRILSVMSSFEHKHVVLGAWGCGAFRNDPALVAVIFRKVLENKNFGFEKVVFAIPDKNGFNYMCFKNVIDNNV